MFYYVEGTVALIEQELAVIDCGGVGYACRTSQNTCAALQCGKKARLYTYLSVRESACDLYGFAEMEELNCFKMLLGVSGVGPKAALAILSSAPPSQLALSIITGDTKFLTRAPGIGKKIAQRICLELKDKLAKEQENIGAGSGLVMTAAAAPEGTANAVSEAVSALMVLGYSQAEAMQAMEGLPVSDDLSAEDLIRACLKKLAAQ
ncbi:Holliday junction branch migration protein RuvA [Butyricicoccus porcorum]|uniref:Holliday junction branch migration complex subunit RuvA n=1 Tax=Butyricicoccus porcorum TaxID=1945634 RepID=A0A252F1T6_9FIRM|nr:Holliday junction branch migration protein RuvA [Butyricicoccus porcorum]MCI6927153.1 Holliday junction branch migration protein RuvA [Butyricicoccus porcorum]MDD6987294.1 Holliday junction branch migration protein RuvA [Butyricicoccus porcorum]MDY4482456.1 Holliday junction branch migration protein RuvA [Butyricicoccus porcorum]OUM19692.1 Holliday junction branch migration protein RuvA [Butyricicoccus porcorum]